MGQTTVYLLDWGRFLEANLFRKYFCDNRSGSCCTGFNVVKQYVSVSDATQNDLVQSQTPAGNSQAPERSTVTIYIGRFDGTTTATTTGQ